MATSGGAILFTDGWLASLPKEIAPRAAVMEENHYSSLSAVAAFAWSGVTKMIFTIQNNTGYTGSRNTERRIRRLLNINYLTI